VHCGCGELGENGSLSTTSLQSCALRDFSSQLEVSDFFAIFNPRVSLSLNFHLRTERHWERNFDPELEKFTGSSERQLVRISFPVRQAQ